MTGNYLLGRKTSAQANKTYHIIKQRRLWRACANTQTRQSHHCSNTQRMGGDEDCLDGYASMGV